MAKGKKNVLRDDKKPQDSIEHKDASLNETKENKPAANKPCVKGPEAPQRPKDCIGKVQSVLLWSPSKPRSPLSDSSSMQIQEGNESDAAGPDTSKLEREIKGSRESKEQKPEMASPSQRVRDQATNQHVQREFSMHKDSGSTAGVLTSKPHSRNNRKHGAKKKENNARQNRKVTDYYPIRRSNRKTKAELKSEEHRYIDDLIKNGIEEGMEIKHIEGKGRGIFAVKAFKKGEFVVEYHGDLLELAEAKKREAHYAQDPQTGCYMYYFQYQSKTYCVDATKETIRLGRLINHSKTGNCQTKLHPIDGVPHLILVASRDIKAEEELLYDYGDRSKDSIMAHPWLKY